MAGDTSGVLELATNGSTTALTIDTSQNVGIGTSSPSFKLDIVGSAARISNAGTANFATRNSTAEVNWEWGTDGSGNGFIYSGQSSALVVSSNATERMRIDSSGLVGIGTTGGSGQLEVRTAGANRTPAYLYPNVASSTATPAIRCVKYDNNSTTSQVFVQFAINQDGANNGQINANGASTAAFGSYSDARLKENIVDLPSQLGNIMALRPVEFDYIGVEDGHQIGFIAQEMQEVYPDAISVGNDEMLMITAWSKTEARLVKAIQEQQTIINDLKARITALEGAA
jgi:hypothetical protein